MLDYKLCKELKDAGFPQNGNGKWIGPNTVANVAYNEEWSNIYVPTLSELIEACGNNITLEKYKHIDGHIVHQAMSKGKKIESLSSFEEAVARLYLSLNSAKVK